MIWVHRTIHNVKYQKNRPQSNQIICISKVIAKFIKNEIEKKKIRIQKIIEQNLFDTERLEMLKEILQKQNLEYLAKEKQIVTFLECKKTFFGRVKYFFKNNTNFCISAQHSPQHTPSAT